MKTCPQCSNTYESSVGFCPLDGMVLEDAQALTVGQVLDGQYEIEAFIARGGMGTLYRARHILLGDRVVIKTLLPDMRANSEWLRRFQREGQAARRFRHPNAVIVYDLRANADGLTYMVMEYVEGQTLDKELRRRQRFAPAAALDIIEPVARALDVAHTHGVVHRDLKPENVMLGQTPDGRLVVKLLDLGIAKLRGVADVGAGSGGGALTVAGQILGTPYYMSPEQWGAIPRDGSEEIDGRTDIYSLGVMCYELCSGHKPFVGRSMPEMQQAHLTHEPRPLNEVAPDVPEALARAVARAMAKDRADRPATAGAFADELRTALDFTVAPRSATTTHTNVPLGPQPTVAPGGSPHTAAGPATGYATVAMAQAVVAAGPKKVGADNTAAHATSGGVAAGGAGMGGTTQPARPSVIPWLIAGVVGLLLVAAMAAGGWYLWRQRQARPVIVAQPTPGGNANTNAPGTGAPELEVANYWLEVFDGAEPTGRRVAAVGAVPLRSGQQFKFHFMPRARGYFYVVGPGAANAPTTFLTAQPLGRLKTNVALAGADFAYPYGAGAALQLDPNPGTEEYTVIYAPTPLLTPAFLAAPAGHALTPAEQAELEALRGRAQTVRVTQRVKETETGQAVVVVVGPDKDQPAADTTEQSIFFWDIRIEHH